MRNNARRTWADTLQNCAITNRTIFQKNMCDQGVSVGSQAI